MSAPQRRARDRFNEAVLTRDGGCIRRGWPDHECDGPLDFHHIVKRQTLMAHTGTLPELERWEIVYDPRIGCCVCRYALHDPLTRKSEHLRPSEIGPEPIAFAHDNGLEWALEKEVPGLFLPKVHTNA